MGFGAKTEKISRGSQATPLAENLLQVLQGQLSEGAFGTGVGPLQRQAGDALGRFIDTKQNRPQGVLSELAPLFAKITDQATNVAKEGIADTRERASIGGMNRLGTGVANLESQLLEQIGIGLGAELGRIGEQARQFDEQSLLGAMGMLQGFGSDNIMPFLQLAQLGILPEEIIQTPGVGGQLLGGLLQAGGGFLGGPGGAAAINLLFGDN